MRNELVAIVLVVSAPVFAQREDIDGYGQSCRVPPSVVSVKRRSELPPVLRTRFNDVAMPGEAWNAGDVGPPGQGFEFIWHNHNRWVLELGHGGFGTWFEILVYDVTDDGREAVNVAPRSIRKSLCSAATKFAMYPALL